MHRLTNGSSIETWDYLKRNPKIQFQLTKIPKKKPPWTMPGGFFLLNQINLTISKNNSHEKTNHCIFLERNKSIFDHAFGGNEQDDKGKQQEIENGFGIDQVKFSE
jgi:hypothetical protein